MAELVDAKASKAFIHSEYDEFESLSSYFFEICEYGGMGDAKASKAFHFWVV